MQAWAKIGDCLEECQIACLERAAGIRIALILHIHLYALKCL